MSINIEIYMYKLVRSNEEFNNYDFKKFCRNQIAIISFSEIIAHFLNELLHG